VNTVSALPGDQILAHTADLMARLRATDEAREGMRAFLDKSRPSWTEQD
jgi:methylglutaconyl-CoA hydratase